MEKKRIFFKLTIDKKDENPFHFNFFILFHFIPSLFSETVPMPKISLVRAKFAVSTWSSANALAPLVISCVNDLKYWPPLLPATATNTSNAS